MPNRTATLVTVVVASSLTFAACQAKQTPKTQLQTATPVAQTTSTTTTQAVTVTPIANGKELTMTAQYSSPAGQEQVGFTLDIDKDGIITDAKTKVFGLGPMSVKRQTSFAEALPAVIKGKKLSELSAIDRVGGSSLTTGAFNEALGALKAKI